MTRWRIRTPAEAERERRRARQESASPRNKMRRVLRDKGLKMCPGCNYILKRSDFPQQNGRPCSRCKPCTSAQASAWARKHPEVVARRNNERRIRTKVYNQTAHDEWVLTLRADRCVYCGGPGNEIDHIEPLARGGSPEWDNLTLACAPCNRSKKAQRLLTFLLNCSTTCDMV